MSYVGSRAYVVFPNLRSLLTAWHHCRKDDNQKFPEMVLKTNSGEWAAPQASLVNLQHVAKQNDLTLRYEAVRPPGNEVPLKSCINGPWIYRDPITSTPSHKHDSAVTRFTSPSLEREYLLAAQNPAQAAQLLHVLTDHLAMGIHAVPMLPNDGQEFDYFWQVTGPPPPLAAMYSAARVWWGPIGGEGVVPIYKQWPYDLDIADELLHSVPWGNPNGIVLLSKHAPQVLILQPARDGLVRELIEVVDLQPAELNEAQAMSPPYGEFEVEVKLRPRPARHRLAESIKQLERDLDSKRRRLERMKEELLHEQQAQVGLPQPLILFYPDRDRPRSVPRQLQRLLIEWSGQRNNGRPSDLESLRYLKLRTASFPRGLDTSAEEVHVLTTAAALGQPGEAEAGLKLLDYRQEEAGTNVWFELLSEWKDRLCLFVPARRRLNLRPSFSVSDFAASKLATALLQVNGNDKRECERFACLLVPTPEDKISACRIPKNNFKPLVDAIKWDCALETELYELAVIEKPIAAQREHFVKQLEDELYNAAGDTARARLKRKDDQLRNQLTSHIAAQEARQNELTKLEGSIHRFDSLFGNVKVALTELHQAQKSLRSELVRFEQAEERLASCESLLKELITTERACRRIKLELEQLHKHDLGSGSRRR